MIKFILILTLIGNLSYAEDVIFLKKGQAATFDGYLAPEEIMQQARKDGLNARNYKLLNESLTTTIDLQNTNLGLKDKQIGILLDQNDRLAKSLYVSQATSTIEKIAFIGLGIIITGLAIKGAHELYK